MGLLRRAMTAIGDRCVQRGTLSDREHAVELTIEELLDTLAGEDATELAAARRTSRAALTELPAPSILGPRQDPPLRALPTPMRTMATALITLRDVGITDPERREPLHGVGIGTAVATGLARVAADPAEALARFEPGDIIVTRGTCPAWSAILARAGRIVTEEGGLLSHAAVIARELGLTALIGATGALDGITDRAAVVIDPTAGVVTIQ